MTSFLTFSFSFGGYHQRKNQSVQLRIMGKKRTWNSKRKREEKIAKQKEKEVRIPYKAVPSKCPKMEAYYAYQGLHSYRLDDGKFVPCISAEEMEEERKKWASSMRSMLPAAFRIGQNIEKEHKDQLIAEVQKFIGTEIEIEVDEEGNSVSKPRGSDRNGSSHDTDVEMKNEDKPQNTMLKKVAPGLRIPFIPDAYQLPFDRKTIRRNPALQDFFDWLRINTDAGFVSRQETVSMIPPVVLAPEPHHAILDMCAAPGSKTSQLLEMVSDIPKGQKEPVGFVVANDSDAKRAYMLVHQLRRINSPSVFVTAKDAQFWPLLTRGDGVTDEDRAREGIFDRVLCDVPCGGDGTSRKNPGIWKHWSMSASISLHPLQASILLNGARLTKVGGYVCYSTCSMNPIENEAVVAEILRIAEGSLELVDKRPDMEGMIARPGMTTWKVMTEALSTKERRNKAKKNSKRMQEKRKEWKQNQEVDQGKLNDDEESAEETQNEVDKEWETERQSTQDWNPSPVAWDEETLMERCKERGLMEYKSFEEVPQDRKSHVRKSCFPPSPEEIEKFNLQKCLRCLPHDLNTGGFFVALFKKVAPLSARAKKKASEIAEQIDKKKFQPEGIDESDQGKDDEDSVENKPKKMKVDESNGGKEETLAQKSKNKFGFNKSESFVAVEEDVIPPIVDYYGMSETFGKNQLMTRAHGGSKLLYFITDSVKRNLIDRGVQDRLQVISSGLRAFQAQDRDGCREYRPCQESIHFIGPHMTKRKLIIDYEDFVNCIKEGFTQISTFSGNVAKQMRELTPGSFVVALKGYENDIQKKFYLVMHRARGDHVQCLIARPELEGIEAKVKSIVKFNETKGFIGNIKQSCSIQ
jgi:16S rRNA C967 or C1407 C5-methylase (RsmB/RsmF family)